MKQGWFSRRLQERLYDNRHVATVIVSAVALLGLVGLSMITTSRQAAERFFELPPATLYLAEFRMTTASGSTGVATRDTDLLRRLHSGLKRGEPVAGVYTRAFKIALFGRFYAHGSPGTDVIYMANDVGGPWYAVVDDVTEVRVADDEAVEHMISVSLARD